jgi:hypothetical protein
MPRRYGLPTPQEPLRAEQHLVMPLTGTVLTIIALVGAVVYALSIAGVVL